MHVSHVVYVLIVLTQYPLAILHPGLFAGGGHDAHHSVLVDYFKYTDNEVYPVDEA